MELPTPRTARNSSNPMVWGSLHYISSKGRRVLNFTKQGDESGTGGYLFGRSQECDEVLPRSQLVEAQQFLIYKEAVYNAMLKGPTVVVHLKDMSDYGTYVNGIKIGLGNTIRLHDKDQITFVTKEMTTTAPDGRHLRRRVLSSPYVFASAYPSHDQSFDGQYRRGRSIGIGNSATVFTAQDRKTKALRAVKVIKKRVAFDARTESRLEREISILMAVNHPNLIKVTQVFNEKSFYYIVMEYARGGELFDLIQNRTKFTESETRHIFKQVFSGVQYLHERGIIHRDLKPENILVADQETLTVKISDFGMAKMTSQDTALNTFCGTTNYIAPEMFLRRKYHRPVDMWSLGVVLYICLCGFPPFSDELAPPNLKTQILEGIYRFQSPYWDDVSDEACSLVEDLLRLNPTERLTVEQAIAHPWMKLEENEGTFSMKNMDSPQPTIEKIIERVKSTRSARLQLRAATMEGLSSFEGRPDTSSSSSSTS